MSMTDQDRRDLFAAAALCGMWSHPGMGVDYGRAATAADGMLAELRRRDAEAAVAAWPTLPPAESPTCEEALSYGEQIVRITNELNRLRDAAKALYDASEWVTYSLPADQAVALWRNLHDALGADAFRRRIEPAAPPTADAAVGLGSTERTRCYDAIGDEIPAEAVPSLLRAEIARLTAEVERLRTAATLDEHERKAIAIARSAMADHYSMSGIHNVADDVLERLLERLGGER